LSIPDDDDGVAFVAADGPARRRALVGLDPDAIIVPRSVLSGSRRRPDRTVETPLDGVGVLLDVERSDLDPDAGRPPGRGRFINREDLQADAGLPARRSQDPGRPRKTGRYPALDDGPRSLMRTTTSGRSWRFVTRSCERQGPVSRGHIVRSKISPLAVGRPWNSPVPGGDADLLRFPTPGERGAGRCGQDAATRTAKAEAARPAPRSAMSERRSGKGLQQTFLRYVNVLAGVGADRKSLKIVSQIAPFLTMESNYQILQYFRRKDEGAPSSRSCSLDRSRSRRTLEGGRSRRGKR